MEPVADKYSNYIVNSVYRLCLKARGKPMIRYDGKLVIAFGFGYDMVTFDNKEWIFIQERK